MGPEIKKKKKKKKKDLYREDERCRANYFRGMKKKKMHSFSESDTQF